LISLASATQWVPRPSRTLRRAGVQERLQQRFDPVSTTNYTSYENRDRLKTVTTPEGTLNYTYDAHGNILTTASSLTNGASLTVYV